MKIFTAVTVLGLTVMGFAAGAQAADQASTPAITQYTYGTKLDIAKVVDSSPIPDVCGVAPATMTYIDHQGQKHEIQYQVMGNGCSQS